MGDPGKAEELKSHETVLKVISPDIWDPQLSVNFVVSSSNVSMPKRSGQKARCKVNIFLNFLPFFFSLMVFTTSLGNYP